MSPVSSGRAMTTLSALTAGGRRVDEATWRSASEELRQERLTLLGLWGERAAVHMALLDESVGEFTVLSLDCPAGRFPSISAVHPPALRLERAIRDLFGLEPDGAPDLRPWLDHGKWGVSQPLGTPRPRGDGAVVYDFLPTIGES